MPAPGWTYPIALTVAGLRYLHEAEPFLRSFVTMIQHLIDRKRSLAPFPAKVVEATVTSAEIASELLRTSSYTGATTPLDTAPARLPLPAWEDSRIRLGVGVSP